MKKICWIVGITAMSACSSPDSRSLAAFQTRDSAGVAIAENDGNPQPLSLTEDLRIGAIDGPEYLQFYRVRSIVVSEDGRLFVVNAGSSEVRVFAADGRFVGVIGSAGDGPGEFRGIATVIPYQDTIMVSDARHRRASWFGADFSLLRTASLADGSRVLYPMARIPEGWLVNVLTSSEWPYQIGVPYRSSTEFAVAPDPDFGASGIGSGGPVVTLSYEGPRRYGIASTRTMTANTPLFEPEPSNAVDSRGRIYVSNGADYEIRVFAPSGNLEKIIRRRHTPVPVTDALRRRYFDEAGTFFDTVATGRHGSGEDDIARDATLGRESLPQVNAIPALGRLLVSNAGDLWVERPDLVDDPLKLEWDRAGVQDSFWDVFRSPGELVGTVRLSSRFTPRAVTGPAVLGVLRDSLDVEYVVRYLIPWTQ